MTYSPKEFHEILALMLERIEFLENQLDQQNLKIDAIGRERQIVQAELPVFQSITKIECEIFYTDPHDIPRKYKKVRTVWSLQIAFHSSTHKVIRRNVALRSGLQFSSFVENQQPAPDYAIEFASKVRENDLVLCGFVKSDGPGRPNLVTHFLAMTDYQTDPPHVAFCIDGEIIHFPEFKTAAGEKKGHAKWYSVWRPEPRTL